VTYRVTTKYFLGCAIASSRCEIGRTCQGSENPGGGEV